MPNDELECRYIMQELQILIERYLILEYDHHNIKNRNIIPLKRPCKRHRIERADVDFYSIYSISCSMVLDVAVPSIITMHTIWSGSFPHLEWYDQTNAIVPVSQYLLQLSTSLRL